MNINDLHNTMNSITNKIIEKYIDYKNSSDEPMHDKETEELYNYLIEIHKMQQSSQNADACIFAYIVLFAHIFITEEIISYKCNNIFARNEILLHSDYSLSQLDYLKLVVFKFIERMYLRYQDTPNLYQETKNNADSDKQNSAGATELYGRLRNYRKTLIKEYESAGKSLHYKESFDHINMHSGKKENDRVLLRHEYDMYRYKKTNEFNAFFLLLRKIENSSIGDKKHYSIGEIEDAFNDLESLYNKILTDDMPCIDKCMLFEEIESRIQIELFYKWLKALKAKGVIHNPAVLECIAALHYPYAEDIYLEVHFPHKNFYYYASGKSRITAFPNHILFKTDTSIEYYLNHLEKLDTYLDKVIALNVLLESILDGLEEKFDPIMKNFDFYGCQALNKFLIDFIALGQHITQNKNPIEDINLDDFRSLYMFMDISGKDLKEISPI